MTLVNSWESLLDNVEERHCSSGPLSHSWGTEDFAPSSWAFIVHVNAAGSSSLSGVYSLYLTLLVQEINTYGVRSEFNPHLRSRSKNLVLLLEQHQFNSHSEFKRCLVHCATLKGKKPSPFVVYPYWGDQWTQQ